MSPNPAGLDPAERKRANRRLIRGLVIMTAGSFAFGWALVPLYDVFCKVAGVGNAEAKAGAVEVARGDRCESRGDRRVRRRPRLGRQLRIPAGGALDAGASGQALRHRSSIAKNLTGGASVAQAVPSISPTVAAQYFHKTQCFCFSPQHFAVGEGRDMPVRFIVDPQSAGATWIRSRWPTRSTIRRRPRQRC